MHKAKEMRKRAGLTREQVADIMGVSWQTVRYWELKEDALRLDTAVELCKLYGCKLSEMAGIDEAESPTANLTEEEKKRVEDFIEGMRSK